MKGPSLAAAIILTLAPAVAIAVTPERTVRFQQVAFRFDSTLATGVDARIVPAVPLADPSDVPDGVGPEHLLFTFRHVEGATPSLQRAAATLRVYPVAAYEAIWPPAKETIDALKDLLAARRSKATRRFLSCRGPTSRNRFDRTWGSSSSRTGPESAS